MVLVVVYYVFAKFGVDYHIELKPIVGIER